MATIQYTTYRFNRPPLIDEEQYTVIKHKLQSDPSFNPFKGEGFYEKYKIVILLYVIGVPVALLLAATEVGFLEVIGGIYCFLALMGLFSLVPEWISYASYLASRNLYFKKLLNNIKKSSDYNHFKSLMR